MDTLRLLENKYRPSDPPPEPGALDEPGAAPPAVEPASGPPATWRDSAPVVALSEFLKPRPWVRLVSYGPAGYGLRFEDPGVCPAEPERWATAKHALALLAEACEDIEHLRRIGRLPLPEAEPGPVTRHTWDDKGRRRPVAGPSRTPGITGVAAARSVTTFGENSEGKNETG